MDNSPKKLILNRRKSPSPNASAKVYFLDGKIEIETVEHTPANLNRFRKVSNTEYLDTATGELRAYRVRDGTKSRPANLKKKFATLRRLINNNFAGRASELHIVLTYGRMMNDPHQLYEDYRRFWDKLKRQYPSCCYITIAEPQQTGSLHLHVLLKDLDGHPLFIPKEQLDRLWGHGFTWVRNLKGNNNIGVYFMAHLSNADESENKAEPSDSKSIIKGVRLSFYPPKFKLYRYSKGIQKPIAEVMPYENTKLLTEGYRPTFSQQVSIVQPNEDGTETELNAIFYEHYKF